MTAIIKASVIYIHLHIYTCPRVWADPLGPPSPSPGLRTVCGREGPARRTVANAAHRPVLSTAQDTTGMFSSGKGFIITQWRREEPEEEGARRDGLVRPTPASLPRETTPEKQGCTGMQVYTERGKNTNALPTKAPASPSEVADKRATGHRGWGGGGMPSSLNEGRSMRRNPSFQAGICSQCPARFLLGPRSGHRNHYFPHLCEEKCKNRKKNLEEPT